MWTERRIVNVKLVVHIATSGLYRVKSQLYYRTNIYIYLINCRDMRTGWWRGSINVRRANNRRNELQAISSSTERLRNLHSTAVDTDQCLSFNNGTMDAGLRHTTVYCTTRLTQSPPTIWQHSTWRQKLPKTGVGQCRTARKGALLRQPTAPELTKDLPAFYGSWRLSLSSARLIQSRPSCFSTGTVGYATTKSFHQ